MYDYDFVCFYYISDLSIVIGFCQTETSVKIVKSFIILAIINKEKLEFAGCYFTEFGAVLLIFLLQASWSVVILNYTLIKDGFPKRCQKIFVEL